MSLIHLLDYCLYKKYDIQIIKFIVNTLIIKKNINIKIDNIHLMNYMNAPKDEL